MGYLKGFKSSPSPTRKKEIYEYSQRLGTSQRRAPLEAPTDWLDGARSDKNLWSRAWFLYVRVGCLWPADRSATTMKVSWRQKSLAGMAAREESYPQVLNTPRCVKTGCRAKLLSFRPTKLRIYCINLGLFPLAITRCIRFSFCLWRSLD